MTDDRHKVLALALADRGATPLSRFFSLVPKACWDHLADDGLVDVSTFDLSDHRYDITHAGRAWLQTTL